MRKGRGALAIVLALLLPVGVSSCMFGREGGVPWYEARRDPTGLAPDPAAAKEAVIQVYAARAVAWRGAFAVHTWIALKPADAPRYTRYDVVGFGVANGAPAVRVDRIGPDNYWFGARPELILDRRGEGDEANSSTRYGTRLPHIPIRTNTAPGPAPTATPSSPISRAPCRSWASRCRRTPSARITCRAARSSRRRRRGTGYQLSLFGTLGILAARKEGIELNLLGLNLGIDFATPGVMLPGIGRLGVARQGAG